MPGDRWQKLANLRALYAYMWAHPGKKLLFMGGEFAQEQEWSHERSLDWHLLEDPEPRGLQALVRDLNRVYRDEPALWELDFDPTGFCWLEANDADRNVVAFARRLERRRATSLVCVCNLSPVPREGYRVGLPRSGRWREALNTDAEHYGGSDVGNWAASRPRPCPGRPAVLGRSHAAAARRRVARARARPGWSAEPPGGVAPDRSIQRPAVG